MSTQLDFIMQLYMMNLLQQQQQQQQQQQHQQQQQQYQQQNSQPQDLQQPHTNATLSPIKQKNELKTTIIAPAESTATTTNSKTTTTTTGTTTTKEYLTNNEHDEDSNEQQDMRKTTKRSEFAQNTNYSSSRSSCSPNSNSSFNMVPPILSPQQNSNLINTNQTLEQLLLNKLSPPVTKLPTVVNPFLSASNILLTPTTPNSALKQLTDLIHLTGNNGDNLNGHNSLSQNIPVYSHPFYNNQISAETFLQSSTVTSTPTEKRALALQKAGESFFQEKPHNLVTEDSEDEEEEGEEEEEEDNKPLSSLYNSSGTASTSTGSRETTTSSKLLISGLQNLESTTDSVDSLKEPFTPNKQAADSSVNKMSLFKENEDSNVATPLLHANAMPTPPSSEPLASKSFETQTSLPFSSHTTLVNASTACSSDSLTNEENLKNLRKVSSYLECDNILCRQENLREHFHCYEEPCKGKILSKKDDIIRHLKWHKKRKESLNLGFARFTSSDDCSTEYGANCSYNWKQTHYHCIYEDCPKVYVSTSDVQMHANFHRKNTEIVQEGFRRFRAHENCKIEDCPFFGKRISHYHCCREGCNHTFKNKADMEKHKSYHLKDYQLTQDGFKKILKTEPCPFAECKYSTVSNHIHCVRENCNYILHSSSQMISHKRKHDRLDNEQAYQHFKKEKDLSEEDTSPVVPNIPAGNISTPLSSLSAEHFLSRKRGRPPKKIQMPFSTETNADTKRVKLETNAEPQLFGQNMFPNLTSGGFFPPFWPNFNPPAQNLQANESAAPNLQLTHLMALFQLQNPLFYQNLYPGSAGVAANMANVLNAATAGIPPTTTNGALLSNSNTTVGTSANATIKQELEETQQQFKE